MNKIRHLHHSSLKSKLFNFNLQRLDLYGWKFMSPPRSPPAPSSTVSGILLNKEYYVNESFSASWHCVLSVPVVFIFIALMGCGGVFIVLHSLFHLLLLLLWASHPALLNGVDAGTNPPPHMTCEYYEVIGDAGGGGGSAALSAYTTWRRLHHCWMTLSASYLVVNQS